MTGTAAGGPAFLGFADQGMYLAHKAGGQHAVIQMLWRYRRPVDMAGLERFADRLARGRLARLVRPAVLPFGRHRWGTAPVPMPALTVGKTVLAPAALWHWADAQVERPLDPALGPGWTLSAQGFSDGSTVVSLVVSHCIADGTVVALAVTEAVKGVVVPPPCRGGAEDRAGTGRALAGEVIRLLRDMPATLRALAGLVRVARARRREPAAVPPPACAPLAAGGEGDAKVAFASVSLCVPLAEWDGRARQRDGNRLALLVAVTAAFAEALGRVSDGKAKLVLPVSQREARSEGGGNRVALARMDIAVAEVRGSLRKLRRPVQGLLVRARREADPLSDLLPLVPFVPERAFSAAGQLALGAAGDMPVTCSYLGDWQTEGLCIDASQADSFCFRGVDRAVTRRAMEARRGVATLLSGASPESLYLNFVAYQPGGVTTTGALRALVDGLMDEFGIAGASFDA